MLPNRPVHIVHRQRMALIQSVSYSMAVPNGECTTQSELHYVRGLRRDGNFRHTATGGKRMPVDYSGLFSGSSARQKLSFGSGFSKVASAENILESKQLRDAVLANTGRSGRDASQFTNWSCSPMIKDRWMESGAAFSDQADSTFRKAASFQSQTSGAQGFWGELPAPPTRGATSNIGARAFRKVPASGDPSAAVHLPGSGVSSSADTKEASDTKPYDYLQVFHNPWPFSILDRSKAASNIFSQWGFTRKISEAGAAAKNSDAIKSASDRRALRNARTHKGKMGGWHTGVDFSNLKKPTPAYTPIALHDIRAVMSTGWLATTKGASSYRQVPGDKDGNPPADVVKFLARHMNKKPYVITKQTGEIPGMFGAAPTPVYQNYYLVCERDEATYKRIVTEANKGAHDAKKVSIEVRNTGAATGLMVYGHGVAVSPKNPNLQVACKLLYVHCHKLVKDATGKYYLGSDNTPKQYKTAAADTVVTYAGNTGTSNIHLHFEMYVYPPGSEPTAARGSTSDDAWKAVTKANEAFLRTQMQMKLTGGGGLNSNKLTPAWQRFFASKKTEGGSITTVDQATEYLAKKSKKFYEATGIRDGGKNSIPTNPLFFFRPEQIIKTSEMRQRYARHVSRYGNRFYAATSGSSICGSSSNAAQEKISLTYSACAVNARKQSKSKNRRAALKECRDIRKDERKALAGNVKLRQKDTAARTERVIAARVKAQTSARSAQGNI